MNVGQTFLCDGIEYLIKEMPNHNTIIYQPNEINISSKKVLEECLNKTAEPELCIVKWFISAKKLTHYQYPTVRNADVEKALPHVKKLRKLDGFSLIDIVNVLDFALKNDFWKDQLLTLTRIRSTSANKSSKFENIRAAMMRQKTFDNKKDSRETVADMGSELT